MGYYFFQEIGIRGANFTTEAVLWSMIIFLVVLVSVLTFYLVKELKNRKRDKKYQSKQFSSKGFGD